MRIFCGPDLQLSFYANIRDTQNTILLIPRTTGQPGAFQGTKKGPQPLYNIVQLFNY